MENREHTIPNPHTTLHNPGSVWPNAETLQPTLSNNEYQIENQNFSNPQSTGFFLDIPQVCALEQEFCGNMYLNQARIHRLSENLQLSQSVITDWFFKRWIRMHEDATYRMQRMAMLHNQSLLERGLARPPFPPNYGNQNVMGPPINFFPPVAHNPMQHKPWYIHSAPPYVRPPTEPIQNSSQSVSNQNLEQSATSQQKNLLAVANRRQSKTSTAQPRKNTKKKAKNDISHVDLTNHNLLNQVNNEFLQHFHQARQESYQKGKRPGVSSNHMQQNESSSSFQKPKPKRMANDVIPHDRLTYENVLKTPENLQHVTHTAESYSYDPNRNSSDIGQDILDTVFK